MSAQPPPYPPNAQGPGAEPGPNGYQGPPPPWYPPSSPPPGPPLTPGGLRTPPPGADFPGKGLGIAGLIVAIFANVIGIVLSAIALNQSKRAGYRNGPAKAGVIVGSVLLGVGLLVGGIFAAIGIAIGLTAALSVPLTTGDGASPGPIPAPSESSEPGAPPGQTFGGVPLEYAVGDCFMEPTADDVEFVDCAEPHDYEVYADFEVPDTQDGAYPGDQKMSVAADEGCLEAYADFVGAPWEESGYDYAFIAPDETTWTEYDDRLVSCAIVDPEGPVSGSLKGAER